MCCIFSVPILQKCKCVVHGITEKGTSLQYIADEVIEKYFHFYDFNSRNVELR